MALTFSGIARKTAPGEAVKTGVEIGGEKTR
jgi:hypothetical protein